MTSSQCEKQLQALLKKLGTGMVPELPQVDDPVRQIILSFLMWESTSGKAAVAFRKIEEAIVDLNDLRVTMPHELESLIGSRYPRALDRCQRIRACLRDIYLREHAMSLERVARSGKRELRRYVETLDGMVPYVAARVLLVSFGIAAVPADEQLRVQLIDAGAADESVEVSELSTWLTRQVKPSAALETHHALQIWMDGRHGTKSRRAARKTDAAKPRAKSTAKGAGSGTSTKKKKASTGAKKAPASGRATTRRSETATGSAPRKAARSRKKA